MQGRLLGKKRWLRHDVITACPQIKAGCVDFGCYIMLVKHNPHSRNSSSIDFNNINMLFSTPSTFDLRPSTRLRILSRLKSSWSLFESKRPVPPLRLSRPPHVSSRRTRNPNALSLPFWHREEMLPTLASSLFGSIHFSGHLNGSSFDMFNVWITYLKF